MTPLRRKVDLRADGVATADAVHTEDRPRRGVGYPQVEMFRERVVERPSVDVRPGGRRLEELLVARKLVSEKQMAEVRIQQSASGERLGRLLVELGVLDERTLSQVLADQFGLSVVDLRRGIPDPQAVALLPETMARSLVAIPVGHAGGAVKVAIPDPVDEAGIKRISAQIRQPVELAVAPAGEIRRAIESSYRTLGGVARHVERFEATEGQRRLETPLHSVVNADSPVIQVVNLVLSQGLRDRASDVHVEPQEARIRVRYRIDGALHDVLALPDSMGPAVVSRVKIMSGLDIVERRRAQDGQMSLELDGRRVDIRVSTAPTIWGEKVVLRLLERERPLLHLDDVGMPPPTHALYARAARSPFGIVVCTGPTGTGKTTTLYATLREINETERNIVTIEDPVEYVFAPINQIPANERGGMSFADALRSVLRQDPDIILVGEMRDAETAQIAIQAAFTGHLVLSSLHATDAASALHRFLDMGIDPSCSHPPSWGWSASGW